MHRLTILAATFWLTSGCIIEATHATTTVTVQWTIGALASGQATGCMGFEIARLVAQPIDGGAATITDFACDAGSGVSAALAPGQYELALEIRATEGTVFARSLAKAVDLSNADDQRYDATILTDAGYAQVAWTFTAAAGAPVGCHGIDHVRVTAAHGTARFVDIFACDAHQALTHALPAGDYVFTIEAVAADQVVGSAMRAGQIDQPNHVTDLGAVAIAVASP